MPATFEQPLDHKNNHAWSEKWAAKSDHAGFRHAVIKRDRDIQVEKSFIEIKVQGQRSQ